MITAITRWRSTSRRTTDAFARRSSPVGTAKSRWTLASANLASMVPPATSCRRGDTCASVLLVEPANTVRSVSVLHRYTHIFIFLLIIRYKNIDFFKLILF